MLGVAVAEEEGRAPVDRLLALAEKRAEPQELDPCPPLA